MRGIFGVYAPDTPLNDAAGALPLSAFGNKVEFSHRDVDVGLPGSLDGLDEPGRLQGVAATDERPLRP